MSGRVAARGVNVDGDAQADRDNHGGPDQAVYAYARESYAWWERELGRPLAPGLFGENLTLEGIAVDDALVGERWAIGTAVLAVTAPRIPCLKLEKRIGEPRFVRRFGAARRPGAYLRIITAGEFGAGDEVRVVARPEHGVSVRLANEAWLFDRTLMPLLRDAGDDLSERTRDWLAAHL